MATVPEAAQKPIPEWILKGIAEGWIHYDIKKWGKPIHWPEPMTLKDGLSASELFIKWKDEEETPSSA
ncbi:MAG: hypothetical protein SFV18_11255 [Bryobacteraceae bacterium]|nr:hypothetical protein [Bryobacteraceae bacterium]